MSVADKQGPHAHLLERRVDFPPLETFTWLQNGGVSLVPAPVHERHVALTTESFRRGPLHIAFPDEEYPRRGASRARVARFLGADEGEIAVVRGVSEAFAHVMRGIDWQPGDELVTTADEEAALLAPVFQLAKERSVRVRQLEVRPGGDADSILAQATDMLGPRTRLLAFSHVTTDLGVRLPATELCRLADERTIPSFVDLGHSAGAVPVDLHAMGCWYAGALSYKWMLAPYAAGALYVRADHLDDLPILYAGGRSHAELDRPGGDVLLHADTRRFEYGPWAWPLIHAWAASLDYLEQLQVESVFERCAWLASRLKGALDRIDGVEVFTPMQPERSANLVAFGVSGWDGESLTRHLRSEHDIVVRPLADEPDGVRASVAFFTTVAEVDFLVDTIAGLPSMPPLVVAPPSDAPT